MRRYILSSLLWVAAACASAPSAETVTPAPVIAAERAFATRGGEIGWVAAFAEYTAPDGMIGNLQSAPQEIADTPDEGARNLFWWPAYAGIARSGDLGFTTGPFSVDEARTPRGQYFTVWRRQADGSWRWIWDGGPGPRPDALDHGVDGDIPTLPVASAGVGSAMAAIDQVRRIESENGTAGRLAGYVAADAQVYRPGTPTSSPPAANFIVPNGDVTYGLARIEGSEAGDLVFTLGEASWTSEGQERRGLFARIWQFRPDGWRIVYDQLTGRQPD